MFLTRLFALFWLIPLVVSGSYPPCLQDQKKISVKVTAEFRLQSFLKVAEYETTIIASRNFATSFKKYRLAIKNGNSTSSFGDSVQSVIQTVGSFLDTETTGEIGKKGKTGKKMFHTESSKERYTNRNFLQLIRVITYNVIVDVDIAEIHKKTIVDSIPVSSAGNYGYRGKYGATYIEKMFQNEKGGNIVDNTFTVSTCYNESSQQEINELTQLKVELQSLKKLFNMQHTYNVTDQFRQQNIKYDMQLTDLMKQNNRTNQQLSDLKQQNNRTNMQLSGLTNKFQQQNNTTSMELNRTSLQLADLIQQNNRTNMQLSDITDSVYQQKTSLKQMNTTLKQMNTRQLNSLKIVKAHGGLRADKCKFTCVGTTGRDSTSWVGSTGWMYTTVNMSSCGFVDVPVVTTSLEGTDYNMYMTGTAAPYSLTTVQFKIYLTGYMQTSYRKFTKIPSVSTAKSFKWNVNWAAYGYKEC